MNKYLRIVLGVCISLFCLWFVFRGFDFESFKSILSNVTWSYVLLAFVIYITGHLLRSIRWHFLLLPVQNVPIFKLFSVFMFGFLMNNILPARAGELAKAMALKKETKLELPTCLTSIVVDRIFDLGAFLFLIFWGYKFIPFIRIEPKKLIAGFSALIFLGIIFIVFKNSLMIRYQEHKIVSRIHNLFMQIKLAMKSLSSPKTIIIAISLSCLTVFIEVLNIFILSYALHLPLGMPQSSAILLAILFGVAVPASPGSLGTFEFFSKQLLLGMSYSATEAVSFVFFLHVYYLIINCGFGLLYFLPGSQSNKNHLVAAGT